MKDVQEMLTVKEAMRRLGLTRSSAYRLFAHEPDVERIQMPGSRKPIVRVPASVVDRIQRRSANR